MEPQVVIYFAHDVLFLSSPGVILCGWLGLKHQVSVTKTRSLSETLKLYQAVMTRREEWWRTYQ